LRFLVRHPIFLFFIIGVISISYVAYNKIQNPSAATAGSAPLRGNGQATAVVVELVRLQSIADHIESVGTTIANESLNLTTKVSDTVSKVHFNDGAFVRRGDILVELTKDAEASRLAEARASADDASKQYERLQNLAERNLIAPTDVDEARTRAQTADARLEGVMVAMDDRLIRAPFSGVLGFRNISEGSLLSPNTVITTLDDISLIKLDFTISEIYLAAVQVGQSVKALSVVYPDRAFEGIVRVVGSRIDPITRSVSVRAHIDNPDGTLRPGMLLTVTLALNEYEAVVIPEQAVVPSQGKQYVFTVDDENIARRVEVELGRRRPGLVEVINGVVPGQRVVTQGTVQVRPGQPVRILNQSSAVPILAAPEREADSADAAVS